MATPMADLATPVGASATLRRSSRLTPESSSGTPVAELATPCEAMDLTEHLRPKRGTKGSHKNLNAKVPDYDSPREDDRGLLVLPSNFPAGNVLWPQPPDLFTMTLEYYKYFDPKQRAGDRLLPIDKRNKNTKANVNAWKKGIMTSSVAMHLASACVCPTRRLWWRHTRPTRLRLVVVGRIEWR